MSGANHVIYICYPQGRHKVLTTSWDDGRLQDRQLVELLNRYGIRGTFNLNSGIENAERIPQSEYKALYEGHEIACHTVHHPTIARCPLPSIAREILDDREALEAITGGIVTGLAYPNGSYSQEIVDLLPALGIKYARTVIPTYGFNMPTNWLAWNPTCHFQHRLCELGEEFAALYKTQYLYMMYVWGHSYELDVPGSYEELERFCQIVGGRDDIWYATNGEIVAYMEQAERLQYSADNSRVYNPGCQTVWISVDKEIREIPGGAMVTL